jgi:hypothetical protein
VKKDEVPQDHAKAFMGHKKALYAQDEKGRLTLVGSDGWQAEEIVLDQAIAEFERAAAEALARAKAGTGTPLEYHMCRLRMDVEVLAQSTGFFKWRVRRHLRPDVFKTLTSAQKQRYADALGMSVPALETLP